MKNLLKLLVCALSLAYAQNALPLSIKDFATICDSTTVPCEELPVMQAYVGGALDLIATLDEKTDYLETIYCEDKSELLKTGPIIDYVMSHKDEMPNRNAMMLLIQYLVEEGGC